MTEKRLLTLIFLVTLLAGCGPGEATPTPGADQPPGDSPPISTTEPPADASPLEWLAQAAFVAGAEGEPDVIPAELPEGFNALEPEHGSAQAPDGFTVYRSYVTFERSVGGEVNTEDQVTVELSSYDIPEGRTYQLDRIAEQNYMWEFVTLDGQQIARYYTASVDGRIWISGPYLVAIYSGLDTSAEAPWVDAFASLLLEMYPPGESQPVSATEPPPGVTPRIWLAQATFEARGGDLPDILPTELPEGFIASDPEHMSGELPTGAVIYGSNAYFQRPVGGQVSSEDDVSVDLYSYDAIEGRTDHLDLLAEGQEGGTWDFYELEGHRIVRYMDSSGVALMWISGPYLVVIYNELDGSGSAPWIDTFASLYLAMFPPN